jgi:hypothetical protein
MYKTYLSKAKAGKYDDNCDDDPALPIAIFCFTYLLFLFVYKQK